MHKWTRRRSWWDQLLYLFHPAAQLLKHINGAQVTSPGRHPWKIQPPHRTRVGRCRHPHDSRMRRRCLRRPPPPPPHPRYALPHAEVAEDAAEDGLQRGRGRARLLCGEQLVHVAGVELPTAAGAELPTTSRRRRPGRWGRAPPRRSGQSSLALSYTDLLRDLRRPSA
jgi:hypothetical protein